MENPNELKQLILDVCHIIEVNPNISVTDKEKAQRVITHFTPVRISYITPEMLTLIWGIIEASDFICIAGGKEQDLLNQQGLKSVEIKSAFVGRGERYNFGNAIAYLCMEGAQQGFAEAAVHFLAQANQMAMTKAGQLPVERKPLIIS